MSFNRAPGELEVCALELRGSEQAALECQGSEGSKRLTLNMQVVPVSAYVDVQSSE